MTKFLAAVALLATVAVPAIAKDAPAQRSFSRNGQTYVYTATDKGDKTVLAGRAYPSGRDFLLTVRGNRVRGFAGGVPVSFVADTVLPSASSVAVASR